MLPVFSSFGGLGVYKTKALISSRYSGNDCEHVPLHVGMREAGFLNIYLNPNQITLYSDTTDIDALEHADPIDPRLGFRQE